MEEAEVLVAHHDCATLRVGDLVEHSFDPDSPGCEFDVLRSVR